MLPVMVPGSVMAQNETAYRKDVEKLFKNWVQNVKAQALQAGVSEKTLVAAFKGVRLNWKLPDLQPPALPSQRQQTKKPAKKKRKRQPEFASPGRYFPQSRLRALVRQGKEKYKAWQTILYDIERAHGVDAKIVLAVWGRETAFGTFKIPYYAIEALATQAFMGRRKDYFTRQLIIALQILEDGHVTPQNMKSSWAGAMGYTQFMPYDFQKFAVDHNADGKRDIWSNIPDALASTANYLRQNGWQPGKTWGYEVRLPDNFDCRLEGFDKGRPVREWVNMGVSRSYDRSFASHSLEDKAYLLIPGGVRGPAFLVLDNFLVLKTYNPANLYALFIGHVSDRLRFDREFEGKWPGLKTFSRDDIRVLQQQLVNVGYDVGKIDGILGPKTRSIIGAYQVNAKLPLSCYPNKALFAHLAKTPLQATSASNLERQRPVSQQSVVSPERSPPINPQEFKKFYPF